MLVVYFGLSGLIAIPTVKVLIWSMGALVLFYLGWQSIREAGKQSHFETTSLAAERNPFLIGYLVNISNPIAVVFWLGIFGSLISTAEANVPGAGNLWRGLAILIGILSWHTMMAILTHWGKRFVNEKTTRVISVVAGTALLGFGLRFAFLAARALFGR